GAGGRGAKGRGAACRLRSPSRVCGHIETPATRRRRQVETSGRPCDVTALPRGGATARQQQQRQQWHIAASASSSDDDEFPPTTDFAGVVEESPAEASTGTGVEDVGAMAGPSTTSDAEQRWQQVAEQLETLKDILAHLCHLVTPRTTMEREGAPRAATLPALLPPLATRQEDAILRAPRRQTAILATPRADAILNLPPQQPSLEDGVKRSRSRHLTTVKEFSIGGDWSAFACRFLAAVRSARWTDAEALEVLPTLLDDESVRFFRSITADKKKTLCGVFEEMADAYEPPDDAHRRFAQRQRAPEESPVAFRGAVLELAMAAYPDTPQDLLEPLILGKMLELSRDLGIPMPVCGHEKLTSRAAAKCLDAQFNLRRWKQVAAWTGGPVKEGGAMGWDPTKAIYVPDERGPQELTAASSPWPGRGRPGPRATPSGRGRRDAGPALRRNEADCFRCGRRGHYARDCWARFPGPPQQEPTTPDKPTKEPPKQASQARNERYARRSEGECPWKVGDLAWLHCPQSACRTCSRQADRDTAGEEWACSEGACQGCGTFKPGDPSDPAAGAFAEYDQD
ncbi:unnamed protein product, partial [Lampetra fluviatilis]